MAPILCLPALDPLPRAHVSSALSGAWTQVLAECERVYGRDVPNYALNDLRTVGDVAAFFAAPRAQLARPHEQPLFPSLQGKELPPNLTIRR